MTSSLFIPTLAVLLLPAVHTAEVFIHPDVVKRETPVSAERPAPTAIRDSLASLDYGAIDALPEKSARQAASAEPQRSTSRKVIGGALGAAAGFFVGRYLGMGIGGFGGSIIGAPVGAIAGAILGAHY